MTTVAVPPLIPGDGNFATVTAPIQNIAIVTVSTVDSGTLITDVIVNNTYFRNNGTTEYYSTVKNFDTTASTSPTTGSTVILGGLGIGKSLNVGGSITIGTSTLDNGVFTGIVQVSGLVAPVNPTDAANKAYVDNALAGSNPSGPSSAIQFNNSGLFGGSANLEWTGTSLTVTGTIVIGGTLTMSSTAIIGLATPVNPTDAANKSYVDSAVVVTNPGGVNTYIQFNSSGTFGGSSSLTWNDTSKIMTVAGQIQSSVATGTAPFVVSSTTPVLNLTSEFSTNSTNATNSQFISLLSDTTTTTNYIPFSSAITGNGALKTNPGLTYDAANSVLTATTFTGDLLGTALSATTATTASNLLTNTTSTSTIYYPSLVASATNTTQPTYVSNNLRYTTIGGGTLADDVLSAPIFSSVNGSISVNGTPVVLFAVGTGTGPRSFMVAIGAAGSNTQAYVTVITNNNATNNNITTTGTNLAFTISGTNFRVNTIDASSVVCTYSILRVL